MAFMFPQSWIMCCHVPIQKSLSLKSFATISQMTSVTLTMDTSGMKPLFGLVFKMDAATIMTRSVDLAFVHGGDMTIEIASPVCGIVAIRVMALMQFRFDC